MLGEGVRHQQDSVGKAFNILPGYCAPSGPGPYKIGKAFELTGKLPCCLLLDSGRNERSHFKLLML